MNIKVLDETNDFADIFVDSIQINLYHLQELKNRGYEVIHHVGQQVIGDRSGCILIARKIK